MVRASGRHGWFLGTLGVVGLLAGSYAIFSIVVSDGEARRQEQENLEPPPPVLGYPLKGGLRATAEQLDEPYRLKIDSRFVGARSQEEELHLGDGVEPEVWSLTFPAGHDFSAELPFPDPPTFQRALELSSGQPLRSNKRMAVDPSGWLITPKLALAQLSRLTAKGESGADQLALTHALISLVFHGRDELGVSDSLSSLALRHLAELERELRADLIGEKAVLARALGYAEESREFARYLPAGALPAYLRFDDDALRTLGQNAQYRPLWFRRQLERGDGEHELTFRAIPLEKHLTLEGISRRLAGTEARARKLAADSCRYALELQVAQLAGADVAPLMARAMANNPEGGRLVASAEDEQDLRDLLAASSKKIEDSTGSLVRMEYWLELAGTRAGSELARNVQQSYLMGLLASCVGAAMPLELSPTRGPKGAPPGSASVDSSADSAVTDWPALLSRVQTPELKEMRRLLTLLEQAGGRDMKAGEVIASAQDLSVLGSRAHYWIFRALKRRPQQSPADAVPLARYLARHLDTRPEGLIWAAEEIPGPLADARYREYFYRVWAKAAASSRVGVAQWWSEFSTRTPRDALTPQSTESERKLRENLRPDADDWRERSQLTKLLMDAGRLDEVPPLVDAWLRAHPMASGAGLQWALTTMAQVALTQGDTRRAAALFAPVREGQELGTLTLGVRLALARSEPAVAQTYAERALSLYPQDPQALLLGLELAWLGGNAEQAASLLSRARVQKIALKPSLLSSTFFDASHEQAPEDAAKLLDHSVKGAESAELFQQVAQLYRKHQLWKHCGALLDVGTREPTQRVRLELTAYTCRKGELGQTDALRWLSSRLSPEEHSLIIRTAYEMKLEEVLWSLPELQSGKSEELLWTTRAALALVAGKPVDPRVASHFRTKTGTSGNEGIGRYLCGELEAAELISAAIDDQATSRVTYYLGIMAEAQAKTAEAIVWYRACVQTNSRRLIEHRLAGERLRELYVRGLPLAALGLARAELD